MNACDVPTCPRHATERVWVRVNGRRAAESARLCPHHRREAEHAGLVVDGPHHHPIATRTASKETEMPRTNKPCTVPGCDATLKARGRCGKHWSRAKDHGWMAEETADDEARWKVHLEAKPEDPFEVEEEPTVQSSDEGCVTTAPIEITSLRARLAETTEALAQSERLLAKAAAFRGVVASAISGGNPAALTGQSTDDLCDLIDMIREANAAQARRIKSLEESERLHLEALDRMIRVTEDIPGNTIDARIVTLRDQRDMARSQNREIEGGLLVLRAALHVAEEIDNRDAGTGAVMAASDILGGVLGRLEHKETLG